MSSYEDRLWADLFHEHGATFAAPTVPVSRDFTNRRVGLTASALGLLATATVATLALTASTSSPAFALTSKPDGTVTATLSVIAGIAGLNAEFAKRGIRARAVPVKHSCTVTAQLEPGQRYVWGPVRATTDGASSDTIYPDRIPRNQTLMLGAVKLANTDRLQFVQGLVSDPAPTCINDNIISLIIRPES